MLLQINQLASRIGKSKTEKDIITSNIILLFDRFLSDKDAIGWSLNSVKKDELVEKLLYDIH